MSNYKENYENYMDAGDQCACLAEDIGRGLLTPEEANRILFGQANISNYDPSFFNEIPYDVDNYPDLGGNEFDDYI